LAWGAYFFRASCGLKPGKPEKSKPVAFPDIGPILLGEFCGALSGHKKTDFACYLSLEENVALWNLSGTH
jgi:hypothetical protein